MTTETIDLGVPIALPEADEGFRERQSPFTGTTLPAPAPSTPELVGRAISRAEAAIVLPRSRRSEILRNASSLLLERKSELARLIVDEVGKPISLAVAEVERASTTLAVSAEVARDETGKYVPLDGYPGGEGRIALSRPRPIGPVVAITPFNFPLNLVAHKLGPAIAAGCPVLLKPAPQCPLSALALAQVLLESGLPEDHLSVLLGGPDELGAELIESPRVAAVTFTGSMSAGRAIQAQARTAKVLLELGSTAAAIIDERADIAEAAAGLAISAFGYAGQTCVSTQRIYVHEAAAEDFTERFVSEARSLAWGNPLDESVVVGPLIDSAAESRVQAWVDEAVAGGAEVLTGGEHSEGAMAPVVLRGSDFESKVIQEEVFGPVASIQVVSDLDSALAEADSTRYGLQASIYTDDLNHAIRASETLNFGSVLVNESPSFRIDAMPYGGVKDSGNTKEGPASAAAEFSSEQLLVISPQKEGN
jgi:acyl-CoA reductase-like NAD-dependent aldehyde dehydrogenase